MYRAYLGRRGIPAVPSLPELYDRRRHGFSSVHRISGRRYFFAAVVCSTYCSGAADILPDTGPLFQQGAIGRG